MPKNQECTRQKYINCIMCNLRYVFIYLFFSFVLLCALNGKEKRGFIYFFYPFFFCYQNLGVI